MSREDSFWERVNAALDERRDPLADEHVQALLAEQPERLDQLLALRQRLEVVERGPRTRALRRIAAAALALVSVGAAALWLARAERGSTAAVVALPRANDSSRVLSLTASFVRESTELRTVAEFDGRRVVERTERLAPPRALARPKPAGFVALAESIAFTR